jgi:putative tryptophan/tyrosine transport system substrate-binding protein
MTDIRGQLSEVSSQESEGDVMSEDAGCADRFLCVPLATVTKPISDLRLLISGLFPFPLALSLVGALLLALCLPVEAQQAEKAPRIGYLSSTTRRASLTDEAFRQGLRDLGYIDGKNIVIEYRYADGKPDRLAKLAAELVRLKVDIIVTSGAPPVIRAAQQASSAIPIVMRGAVVDPVVAGFVSSLAKPGGNITGLSDLDSDLHPKRLELLKEAVPRISRVAILWPLPQQEQAGQAIAVVAPAFGIQIQSVIVSGTSGLEGLELGLSAVRRERPDAVLIASSQLINEHRVRIVEFMTKNRLPTISASTSMVDVGGLMSYGANSHDLARRTATYVDKILKGRKPADLPVEQPTKFEFVINLKAAKQIGLIIPPNVLARADRVIR